MNLSKIKSVKFILRLLVVILIAHIFFNLMDLYNSITWLDIAMHFLGGVWVGLLFFCLFERLIKDEACLELTGKVQVSILVLAFAAFVGVLWEFFEFVLTNITHMQFQGGMADTMGDLLMDILGGFFAWLICMNPFRKKKAE